MSSASSCVPFTPFGGAMVFWEVVVLGGEQRFCAMRRPR